MKGEVQVHGKNFGQAVRQGEVQGLRTCFARILRKQSRLVGACASAWGGTTSAWLVTGSSRVQHEKHLIVALLQAL